MVVGQFEDFLAVQRDYLLWQTRKIKFDMLGSTFVFPLLLQIMCIMFCTLAVIFLLPLAQDKSDFLIAHSTHLLLCVPIKMMEHFWGRFLGAPRGIFFAELVCNYTVAQFVK